MKNGMQKIFYIAMTLVLMLCFLEMLEMLK
jgi:hypothetical protein